jgi:hypothetical protein
MFQTGDPLLSELSVIQQLGAKLYGIFFWFRLFYIVRLFF